MDLEHIHRVSEALREQVHQVVIGQDEAIDLLLVTLLSEGHILLEGVPGTAKTLLARTFARSLDLDFQRIQFTPDLMPADVLGTNLFNFQANEFVLTKGPVFTQVLLADEINRTPPKTQAALLQAMQERIVTLDGRTHALGAGFLVIATQNPIEQEGTYPLPEAQLDRFLFKVVMTYPELEQERAMVKLHGRRTATPDLDAFGLQPLADLEFLTAARRRIVEVLLSDEVAHYIVDLVRATREDAALQYGASPRAANVWAVASRAYAAISGRDYVIPDDVQRAALPLLRHRVVLAPGAELEGLTTESVVQALIERIPAPR